MLSSLAVSRLAAVVLAVSALAARADALSAVGAQAALARGAVAWDVRAAPDAVIPGAVQAATVDVRRWLEGQGTEWLERSVSAAGIDLSRAVVLYGAPGDLHAQALHDGLTRLASGRVFWLVGGIDEWQAAGLPTAAHLAQRLPVPQRLVPRPLTGSGHGSEMAAPGLRRSEPALPTTPLATASSRG